MAAGRREVLAQGKRRAAIFIPARLGSTRFAGKMLASLHGKPLLAHAIASAQQAGAAAGLQAPIFVAAGEPELAQLAEQEGAKPVLVKKTCASGSDRIHAALEESDLAKIYDPIINWQGDLPFLPPQALVQALAHHRQTGTDITTLAAPLAGAPDAPDKVKAVLAGENLAVGGYGRALYFTRAAAPHGGPYWHHIGLYIFTRAAIKRFVALPLSPLEQQEKLEQLRALEAGMAIVASLIDKAPASIDRPDDLKTANEPNKKD